MENDAQAGSRKWEFEAVAQKSIKAVMALGLRQTFTLGFRLAAGVLLARLLSPSEFGVFGIVTFGLAFLTVFADVGLGASLIRQSAEPTENEYRTMFGAQQLLVSAAAITLWLASARIALAYRLPPHDAIVFQLVAVSFFVSSFQTIPSIRLERHLEFNKLALMETVQSFTYNAVTVIAAYAGLGALSFGLGLLVRSVSGAALINWLSPWKIRWRLDLRLVRSHLRFGLPYQGISVVSLIKDSITPLFVGLLVGTAGVGYITWAIMVAGYPAISLMVFQRIYLPAFSRMQNQRDKLVHFVERALLGTNAFTAPLAVLTLVLVRPVTVLIFGAKWLVALPLFYLFWFSGILGPSSTPVIGLLNALGFSAVTFSFALTWMIATWVLGAPLIWLMGTLGFGVALIGVELTALPMFRLAQRRLPFRIFSVIWPVWAVASLMGAGIYVVQHFLPVANLLMLATYGALGLFMYMVSLRLLYPALAGKIWGLVKGTVWHLASRQS
ncbi:MAG TPA: oligosaccharide flippase family protein [Terriglobia bacterium]|nr:oligosaccharide flippase family protein [Terriglobia bacterium]